MSRNLISISALLCGGLLASCAPKLAQTNVAGKWFAHDPQNGAITLQLTFLNNGSFVGFLPVDMIEPADWDGNKVLRAVHFSGAWELAKTSEDQRIHLRFSPSILAPKGYGNDLIVEGDPIRGPRLVYFRGDPDSRITVEFKHGI